VGITQNCNGSCGVVYELSPNGTGGWTESVLYSFQPGIPYGQLVFDKQGNLYGATGWDEENPYFGIVYSLSPTGGGQWVFHTVHNFGTGGRNGGGPSVIINSEGDLYGTTTEPHMRAFELTPRSGGGFKMHILYTDFRGSLWGPPVLDAMGNLYGTFIYGDRNKDASGAVYKLTQSKGKWGLTLLYGFYKGGKNGDSPQSGVIPDGAGNLYGTTFDGGGTGGCSYDNGCGVVFEITP